MDRFYKERDALVDSLPELLVSIEELMSDNKRPSEVKIITTYPSEYEELGIGYWLKVRYLTKVEGRQ